MALPQAELAVNGTEMGESFLLSGVVTGKLFMLQ